MKALAVKALSRLVFRLATRALAIGATVIATQAYGQNMKLLDSKQYFSDPKLAAFVDDVQRGNLPAVEAALKSGMDPNAKGADGFRPIHFVFKAPTADVTRALLAAGANANARLDNGNTPLHFAVRMPNADFTEALLAAHADPNAIGANHKPVIHEAISSHEPRNLALLANAGADLNVEWAFNTPVQAAIGVLQWEMATALLELGADAKATNRRGQSVGETFCEVLARLQATPTNRGKVARTGDTISAGGGGLKCADRLAIFR